MLTADEIEAGRAMIRRSRLAEYGPMDAGCWNWHGAVGWHGYGQMGQRHESRKGTRTIYAHRESYELFKGPIPDGLQIDHLCSNKACINPSHLEVVTHAENRRRWSERTGGRRVPELQGLLGQSEPLQSRADFDRWRAQMLAERLARNLTQRQAAERLGVSLGSFGYWETGLRTTPVDRQKKLLEAIRELPVIPHAGVHGPRPGRSRNRA